MFYMLIDIRVHIVHGDVCVPIGITIKCKMIYFWSRLVMGNKTKLSYVMYSCLLKLHRGGVHASPWLEYIKNTCIKCGMTGVDAANHYQHNMVSESSGTEITRRLDDLV